MSLLSFHRLLIIAAIVFCAGFALWEVAAFANGDSARSLVIAALFAAAAFGLGHYLRNLTRYLGIRSDGSETPRDE